MADIEAVGKRVWITVRSTHDRRSRASEITAAKRSYEREHDVSLTLVSKSYSETHGFLSMSCFYYRESE